MADGFVEQVETPIVTSFGWAALVGEVEEHWCRRMGQGRSGGVHQAANGAEVRTLCFCQRGSEGLVEGFVWEAVLEEVSRGRYWMAVLVRFLMLVLGGWGRDEFGRGAKAFGGVVLGGAFWGAVCGGGGGSV